jgi:hypothetical protein
LKTNRPCGVRIGQVTTIKQQAAQAGANRRGSNMVVFQASLYNIRINSDGDARIQFDVPMSHLGDVVQMSALTDALLEITVNVKAQQSKLDFVGSKAHELDEDAEGKYLAEPVGKTWN